MYFYRAWPLRSCGPVSISILIQIFFKTMHTRC
ncbi:hypothetical protein E2C01_098574 [Portunus trituberculatus]|uniref:Uncharacterized protein n=1 Tax=Portunus trituberculatus TaxID=210409 RepID=A0A5B7KEI4_PORTR|nr:hypothetical protein [Portunus trituberculatus]